MSIKDEFSDLPVSRQRKWQLRHPEADKAIRRRHAKSQTRQDYLERTRQHRNEYMRQYRKRKKDAQGKAL